MNWEGNLKLLAVVILAIVAPYAVAAEEEGGSTSSADVSSSDVSSVESSASSASSVSSAVEEIEPLEPWIPLSSSSKSSHPSSSLSAASSSAESEVSADEEGYYYPPSKELPPPITSGDYVSPSEEERSRPMPKEKKIKLSKEEEGRLLAAKKKQMKRGRKFRRAMRIAQAADPRGDAEIRLCSLNLNGYGTKEEVKKILKETAKSWITKERAIVSAIREEKCDVVALQRLMGRSYARAQEGMERLIGKLNRKEPDSWSGFLGESERSLAYNGFVFRTAAVEVLSKRHHADLYLPRFEEFVTKQFYRGPVEVTFRVAGKNGAESRVVTLTTMDFRESIKSKIKEPERPRMQMAEALRQIHELNEERISEFSQPVFMILGDRAAGPFAPSARILEGAYRLSEFKKEGRCHLGPTEKMECNDPTRAPLLLLPLLNTNIERLKVTSSKQKDGTVLYHYARPNKKSALAERKARRARTSEIYVSPFDLRLFREDLEREGPLRVGYRSVPNGLPASPLVWAELNW